MPRSGPQGAAALQQSDPVGGETTTAHVALEIRRPRQHFARIDQQVGPSRTVRDLVLYKTRARKAKQLSVVAEGADGLAAGSKGCKKAVRQQEEVRAARFEAAQKTPAESRTEVSHE